MGRYIPFVLLHGDKVWVNSSKIITVKQADNRRNGKVYCTLRLEVGGTDNASGLLVFGSAVDIVKVLEDEAIPHA